MTVRRILTLTGTRADFGKLKPLLLALQEDPGFESEIFVTGMHLLERHGRTVAEIRKAGLARLHLYANQIDGEPMDLALANTIQGLSRHVHESPPDLIVVHGDRVEALAGAIVGSLRNIRTAHIEGGELSGTVDGAIRHSVTKHAHLHFVANDEARKRVLQLGEDPAATFIVGSPEVDVMLGPGLPSLSEVRRRYGLPDEDYFLVAYHPVTTEPDRIAENAAEFTDALLATHGHGVVIAPNNDAGAHHIVREFDRLPRDRFHRFPSMRFEYYLTLLRHADFIIGNSSSGVREAPVYGTPSVDVGTRQRGRSKGLSVVSAGDDAEEIVGAIERALRARWTEPDLEFGTGHATERILSLLHDDAIWRRSLYKAFIDRSPDG